MVKQFVLSLAIASSLTLLSAIGAGAAVVAGNTGWYWSNPLPQGNTLREVDTIAGRAYVAGVAGSIMRSDDGGTTWTGIRSGLPAKSSAVNIVRAVTPDIVVFAGSCGLRRTDDGGKTVRRLPWGSDDVSCPSPIVSLSFPTANVGYLILVDGDILQTQDGGDSWRRQTAAPGSRLLGGSATVTDIRFTTASSGVISVGSQIYYTTDSGSSWTPVQDVGGGGLAQFDFISATEGFAVGSGTSLYKTIDSGASWTAVPSDGKTNGTDIGSISCADANTCLAAASNGAKLLRTTDGGFSWTELTASSSAIFGVGFTSATHAVAVGDGGAIVATNDAGANWSPLTSQAPGRFYAIHVDSPTSAVLIGEGTTLARTTDAGFSYKPLTTFASGGIVDATFPTAQRGYVLDTHNQVTRSDDGGITWKVLDLGGAHPKAIFASEANTLLLIGRTGVRRSVDGGLNFKAVGGSSFRKLKLSNVDKAGDSIVAYGSQAIVISKDGGKTWKAAKHGKKIKEIERLDFADAKSGWIVDSRNELWSTTNAGKTWKRIETTGLNRITTLARMDSKHGYIADTSGSVFLTSDAGNSWAEESPFLTVGKQYVDIAPLSNRSAILLVPGTNRILTTTSLGQIGVASKLKISTTKTKVKKNSKIQIKGKLSGAQGGEVVTVLARKLDAKGGTRWTSKTATVSLGGTFTMSWKVQSATIFVARWAGDATRDGDGADPLVVKLKK